MPSDPWYKRWPHRLSEQEEAFKRHNIPYTLSYPEGRLQITFSYPVDGTDHQFIAHFPDLFPFFRFEIVGPPLQLKRHQNPINNNLCFLSRPTMHWNCGDTVAGFMVERFPKVLEAGRSDTLLTGIDDGQAEPISNYYSEVLGDRIILVDGAWDLPKDVKAGYLTVGASSNGASGLAVLSIQNGANRPIATANNHIERLFPLASDRIRWVKLDSPILANNPLGFEKELLSRLPSLKNEQYIDGERLGFRQDKKNRRYQIDLIGLVFEEQAAEGKDIVSKCGWIFLARIKTENSVNGKWHFNKKEPYLIRASSAGEGDIFTRTPELQFLRSKKIAVFGVGCLGAPSVLEFAKCGVGELRLVDHDFLEPGTITRWPIGMAAIGHQKVEALKSMIEAFYPFTAVTTLNLRVGETHSNQAEHLDKILNGVDLIYDATAEVGIHHYLSFEALRRNIPYVALSTTHGTWGGQIVRVIPGTTGCWWCLSHWQNSVPKTDTEYIISPNTDPNGTVQPVGCADPTFIGYSFDSGQIALASVRLAISTLANSDPGAYPSANYDVAIINLRDENGNFIPPQWHTYHLKPYWDCGDSKCKESV